MVRHIVFDIETKENLNEETERELLAGIEPPKNYKDPKKIQDFCKKAFEEKKQKAALSYLYGRICAIGLVELGRPESKPAVLASDREGELLTEFASIVNSMGEPVIWCGFNIRMFDIPFLRFRLAANRIELKEPFPIYKYDKNAFDLRDILPNGSLNAILAALGLPTKIADGGDVATMSLKEVVEYNRGEMELMRTAMMFFKQAIPHLA